MNLTRAILCILLQVSTVHATDVKLETEYEELIRNTLILGEIVNLPAGANSFLSIYTESEHNPQVGTAIILHDKGGHPDHPDLIHELRTELPSHKWSTLAIQLPVREFGARLDDYYAMMPEALERVESAVDYLTQAKAKRIVLIGYGLGALVALHSVQKLPDKILAIATISIPVPENDNPYAQTIDLISKTTVPFLDLYGDLDRTAVIKNALKKRRAAKNNINYRQLKLYDMNQIYNHNEGLIVKRVYSWLRRVSLEFPE